MIAGTTDPFWRGQIKAQLKAAKVNVKTLKISDQNIELEIEN
jgi:hypothetical protein